MNEGGAGGDSWLKLTLAPLPPEKPFLKKPSLSRVTHLYVSLLLPMCITIYTTARILQYYFNSLLVIQ